MVPNTHPSGVFTIPTRNQNILPDTAKYRNAVTPEQNTNML